MRAGSLIDDRFEVIEETARGGMGTIYRARDRDSGGYVAVKLLATTSRRVIERFDREVGVLAQLDHPGIVRYVGHGVAGERPYLAMEWLEGPSLRAHLDGSGLEARSAVDLGLRLASALGHAHRAGVVHRDVKPGNIVLPGDRPDEATIIDFGIAKAKAMTARRPTYEGSFIGTPGYMAPEQARGADRVGPAADVFSLGCVLFECLVGRPAFVAEHVMALLAKILFDVPPRVDAVNPTLSEALGDVVARMLEKDPSRRPADGAEVAAALTAIGDPLVGAPTPRFTRRPSLGRHEQRLLSVVVAGPPDRPRDHASGRELDGETRSDRTTPPTKGHEIAERFGGRLERLADGSLVVILTGRGAARDQAVAAARSALALRAELGEVPVAVATGRAHVSGGLPVGEVIDRAASDLVRATFGAKTEIRVDAITAALLGPPFQVVESPPSHVLVGDRGTGTAGRGMPFVGRARELRTIEAVVEQCIEEDCAHAVLVLGAAGIGKTRLADEARASLVDRHPALAVAVARGNPVGVGAVFGLVAGLVSDVAGLTAGTPVDARGPHLRGFLEGVMPPDELDRTHAFLCPLVGAAPDRSRADVRAALAEPKLMGDQLRRAFLEWLGAQCAHGPLLVLLDDLQHGDASSIEVLDEALSRFENRPFVVLAFGRPELVQRLGTPFGRRPLTALRLGPLSKRASEALVAEALGPDADGALTARVVEQGAGHPGFLGELVRSVAAGHTSLPDTLVAMVHARLDALGPDARRILRAGSVFGRRFRVSGVRHLLGGQPSAVELDERLQALEAADVVFRAADGGWAFPSDVVREASYGMLTEEDRKLGHRLAAEWLSTQPAPEPAELAEHFQRGDDPPRAVEQYGRAARQALTVNDFHGVMAWVGHAALSGASGRTLGELRLLEAEALAWSGQDDATFRRAREAMALLPAGSPSWFTATTEAVHAAATIGDHDGVVASVEELLAAEPTSETQPLLAVALGRTMGKVLEIGDARLTEASAGRLERLSRDLERPDPHVEAWLRMGRASLAQRAGDLAAKLAHLEAAADAFYGVGHVRWACVQRVAVGSAYNQLGQYELAELSLREALAAAEHLRLPRVVAGALRNLSWAVAHHCDLVDGISVCRDALARFEEMREPRMLGSTQTDLASMLCDHGEHREAAHLAERAIHILQAAPALLPRADAVFARVALEAGHSEVALRHARSAMEQLERRGWVEEGESLIRLVFARASYASGRAEEGDEALRAGWRRLQERASQLDDPAVRTAFLDAVPENARTRDLVAQRGL